MSNTSRRVWRDKRLFLESNGLKCSALKDNSEKNFDLFSYLIVIPKLIIKLFFPIYLWGQKNARNIQLNKVIINDSNLPKELVNLKILHISDLHLDDMPELSGIIVPLIENKTFDICIFTGDYFSKVRNHKQSDIDNMGEIISSIKTNYGIYGVLGNHDSVDTLEKIEKYNIKFLTNEIHLLNINNYQLNLIGVDDVHYFYTNEVISTLKKKNKNYSILLVHSPEIFDIAEENMVNLYLCGHTHGGQVRITKNLPIFRRTKRGRRYFSQSWKYKKMFGYTSNGAGTSTLDIRFNCDPEITQISLSNNKI